MGSTIMHHICTDGRSKVVLLEQLTGYYNAIVAGGKLQVAASPANLDDWAMEERSWLSGSEAKATEDYWKVQPYREGLAHPWPIEREWGAGNVNERKGWTAGRLPSEGFHGHRYLEVEEGFVPGSEEPVLHALLIGMHRVEVRRKLVGMSREPLGLSNVL
jgi:hypothetical protein